MLKIRLDRDALKAMKRMPTNTADLIEAKIEQLATDSDSLRNNITRLVGSDEWRLRVGKWRVIYLIDGDTLVVSKIAPRGGVYD